MAKKQEKAYLDQQTGFAAPVCQLKYTTNTPGKRLYDPDFLSGTADDYVVK